MDDELLQAWDNIGTEDFLLARHLIPEQYQDEILAVYGFAREVDDIADHPTMKSADKQAQLMAINRALIRQEPTALPRWARPFELLLRRNFVTPMHAEEMMSAMLQDVHKTRYQDFDELEAYSQRSAVPLGLMMLEVCEEKHADLKAAEALCHALQMLNILQDASKDFLILERVYIPLQWFAQAGISVEELTKGHMSKAMRGVVERMIERIVIRLREAKPLVRSIHHKRLRLLMACIDEMAWALMRKLKHEDMLRSRVNLSLWEKIGCLYRAWKRA